jgi:hypothetical protein
LFIFRSPSFTATRDEIPTMPRVTKRSWTPEDIERLRHFVATGVSLMRSSVALKRSRLSTQQKAREIGCPFPHSRHQPVTMRSDPEHRI